MNIVYDKYGVILERNPRYELAPMIPAIEWKSLVEYGNERDLTKEGNLPPGTRRYAMLYTM